MREQGRRGGVKGKRGIRVRRSKDETINGEGRKLIKFVEENGWGIFNGCTRGDEEGQYSFTEGKGNTVIDYVIGDLEVRDRIESMKIADRVDSDHHPEEVWIEDRGDREIRKKKGKKREWRGVWDEEGKKEFQQRLGRIEIGKFSMEEQWMEMESRIKEALEEVESKREEGNRRKMGRWDGECRKVKRKVVERS